MLNVHYSNDLEILLRFLIERSVGSTATLADAVLDGVHIVVPNRNIQTWLKHAIARTHGVYAGFEFPFLTKVISRCLHEHFPKHRFLSKDELQVLLVSLFLDDAFLYSSPDLLPLQAYLFTKENSTQPNARRTADIRARKSFQLAGKLAQAFDDYTLTRSKMLHAWEQHQSYVSGEPWLEMERWQRHVWLHLFGAKGILKQKALLDDITRVTFHEIPGLLKTKPLAFLKRPLHIFALSYMAEGYLSLLNELAKQSDIHIYTLNPCLEFWEDITTPFEDRVNRSKFEQKQAAKRIHLMTPDCDSEDPLLGDDPFALDREDNLPLKLWGRPGRENIRMLNLLSQCDTTSAFRDLAAGRNFAEMSLLECIQHDILFRVSTPATTPRTLENDKSLQLITAPDPRREVEIVAEEIWKTLADFEKRQCPLRFNEIGIIVNAAELGLYQTHIRSVFANMHKIPLNIVDMSAAGCSSIIQAALALFELAFGHFARDDILGFFALPYTRSNETSPDLEKWNLWCDRLAVHFGADSNDNADSYLREDVFNWDQACYRLISGAHYWGGADALAPYEAAERAHRVEPVSMAELPAAAGFVTTIRSLLADCRFARTQQLTLTEWSQFLSHFFSAYINKPGDDDPTENALWIAVLQDIGALAEVDLSKAQLPFRTAVDFVKQKLSMRDSSYGHHLIDGVVVSSFRPMRPVPFRAVFLLGMGESKFPASEVRNPIDLRNARRRAGDVKPREQDKYLFLETLVSVRERLTISWVGRDPVNGETLPPSSVVKELLSFITSLYLHDADSVKTLITTHKLRHFDISYFTTQTPLTMQFAPKAHAHYRLAQLRKALGIAANQHGFSAAKLLARYRKNPHRLLEVAKGLNLPETLHQELRNAVRETETQPILLTQASKGVERKVITIGLGQLRDLLWLPLNAGAQHLLSIKEESESDGDELFTAEPLEMDWFSSTAYLKETLELLSTHLHTSPDERRHLMENLLNARIKADERDGRFPQGIFAEQCKRALRKYAIQLEKSFLHTEASRLQEAQTISSFRFGKAWEGSAHETMSPIVFDNLIHPRTKETIAVHLTAVVESVALNSAGHFLHSFAMTREAPSFNRKLKDALTVAYLMAHPQVSDHLQNREQFFLHLPCGAEISTTLNSKHACPVLPNPAAAHDWLLTLILDYLRTPHDYLLSGPKVLRVLHEAAKGEVLPEEMESDAWWSAQIEEELFEMRHPYQRCVVPGWEALKAPPAPLELIKRRYHPWFMQGNSHE